MSELLEKYYTQLALSNQVCLWLNSLSKFERTEYVSQDTVEEHFFHLTASQN